MAMDFSSPSDLDIQHISPATASGNESIDYTAALQSDDDIYMEHFNTGDSTNIIFTGLKSTGETRTIFLHSKGHYLPQDEYEGKMNKEELAKFKNEGEMSRYSKRLFERYKFNYALIKE